ncbi:aconitase X swivel domain-containing protein [Pectinatus cerevisiiphilus]|uniref:Putative aconitase subunit 2 n=1 Tax=Pectinatus cerevisiiphilus TaxID=86956 RepID=A0A4R3K9H2_9FIRM|nr:DUF126 domain-containing protein [Pectinatus cerevisiiphilus]TCS79311.1 putative aconitase subunit 2 [Pectinatus cerevisiiphilus]
MEKQYKCHKISGGKVSGELLFSKDGMCFYLIEPKNGKIIEKEHCLYGQSIAGKILVFPYGKGSSVVQADGMYQLKMTGMNPAGMIVVNADTTLAASAIILDAPMVNKMEENFYKDLHDGDMVELDAENGILRKL